MEEEEQKPITQEQCIIKDNRTGVEIYLTSTTLTAAELSGLALEIKKELVTNGKDTKTYTG